MPENAPARKSYVSVAGVRRPPRHASRCTLLQGPGGHGRRTALPRHQTLLATLDWSYELLSETEARVLRHLAPERQQHTTLGLALRRRMHQLRVQRVAERLGRLHRRHQPFGGDAHPPERLRLGLAARATGQVLLEGALAGLVELAVDVIEQLLARLRRLGLDVG